MYEQAAQAAAAETGTTQEAAAADATGDKADDDVIDAEFEVKDSK